MRYVLFLFLCLLSFQGMSQDISGLWQGTITQNKGAYRTEYALELVIIQKGEAIEGRSYVFVDDIFAEMDIEGDFHSGVYLQMKDTKIISHEELDGMEWCIKSYQLLLKKNNGEWSLEGHWQGDTSFSSCIPGRIKLKRAVPRA